MPHKDWSLVALAVLHLFTTDGVYSSQVSLWVSSVEAYSSQWDDKDYAANEVIGIPNVYPGYGDLKGAWAQDSLNENEYIQVRFEYEIYIEEVNIYETYNCGGVWKVEIMTVQGWVTVWEIPSSQVQQLTDSRIFSPDIIFVQHPSNMVKLTVNCAHANSWVEIDAIQITGSIDLTVTTEEATSTASTLQTTSIIITQETKTISTTKAMATTADQDTTIGTTDQTTELTSVLADQDTTKGTTDQTTELTSASTQTVTSTEPSTVQEYNCCCTYTTNITKETLSVRLEEIRRSLSVPRNLTGRYNRSKLSADDDRPSSIALGTSVGIVTMVLLASLIIACDIKFIYSGNRR